MLRTNWLPLAGSFLIQLSELILRIYLEDLPTALDRNPITGWSFTSASPHRSNVVRWYGNIDPFPIAYAFRPRLRDRLTLSGLTFLRKPWAFGDNVSHVVCRYLCRQSHFRTVQSSSRSTFTPDGTLPYQGGNPEVAVFRSFGI